MGKHKIFVDGEEREPAVKKQKLAAGARNGNEDSNRNSQDLIAGPNDLQRLLLFQPDDARKYRLSIYPLDFKSPNANLLVDVYKFRDFLESISTKGDSSVYAKSCSILLEFLNSNSLRDDDQVFNSLPGLIQAWSFAAQASIDALLSSIPNAIALLLRTISNLIDFREVGVQICKTLLQQEQLKLFDRGLTAYKSREHLVAPCIRLLTEIVAFDGGSCARSLYAQREVTLKRLEAFLSMRKYHDEKPFLRSTALPYLLANLRFQDKSVKSDILTQSRLVRALFHDIKEDPPDVVVQILRTAKDSVIADDTLPRVSKSRLLKDTTLVEIASIYQHYDRLDSGDSDGSAADTAHEFLLSVCTTLDHGVLIKQNGWYPPVEEPGKTGSSFHEPSYNASGTNSTDTNYTKRAPVRNTTLASFLQSLRPYGNVRDKALALAIFQSAPELVADYFSSKRSFSFDPKLTATWIGLSSFLYSVIQQDIPSQGKLTDDFAQPPPPVSIVIESVLPQPLSQKSLTKCLNQSSDLMKFFVARLLIIAFKKLRNILKAWSIKDDRPQWKRTAESLKAQFCQRCPEVKHVIMAFRSCPDTKKILKEAISRLLSLYYTVTPHMAFQEKFDISVTLASELSRDIYNEARESELNMHLLQLNDLLEIACTAPDMNWWHKPGMSALSAMSTL